MPVTTPPPHAAAAAEAEEEEGATFLRDVEQRECQANVDMYLRWLRESVQRQQRVGADFLFPPQEEDAITLPDMVLELVFAFVGDGKTLMLSIPAVSPRGMCAGEWAGRLAMVSCFSAR